MCDKILQSLVLEPNTCPHLCHIRLTININRHNSLGAAFFFLFQPGNEGILRQLEKLSLGHQEFQWVLVKARSIPCPHKYVLSESVSLQF